MTNYNPSAPDRLGLEWPAMRQRWDPVGYTLTTGAIVTGRSTAAFTQIRAYMRYDSTPGGTSIVLCDLYSLPAPPGIPALLRSFSSNSVTTPTGGWQIFTAATAFSFVIGTQYLVVIRRNTPATSVSWATLDCTTTSGQETVTAPDHRAVDVPLDPSTFVPITSIAPTADTGARAIAFTSAVGVYLIDSQVYARAVPTAVDVNHAPITQAMPSSTSQVGSVTIVVRNDTAAHHADPLALSFPDDPSVPPVQFPVGALPLVPDNRWYRVPVELPTPLSSGVAHRVLLSSPTTNDRPWTIGGLTDGLPADTAIAARTFQGAAAGADIGYDALITNDALLAPVTSFTVTTTTLDTARALAGACTVASVPVATLDWPVTSAIEAKLDHYEIERNDDGTWRPIADIVRTTNATLLPPGGPTHFVDMEALRNTPVSYRIRMVTTAGVISAWRTVGPIILPSAEPDVMLFSNWRPDLYWAGQDELGYSWNPVDADRLNTRMLFARNRQFAVREAVFRGDKFSRTLIVAVDDFNMPRLPDPARVGTATYAPPGRVVFDSLLAIAHARDVPYVCLLDAFGRRWYTAPAVTALRRDEPFQQYRADATFVEVSDIPAPLTLANLPQAVVTGQGWDNVNWDDPTTLWG